MKILTLSLVVLTLLGSLGFVAGQQQVEQRTTARVDNPSSRQQLHDAKLKKLFSKVGLEVDLDALKSETPSHRQVKIVWRDSAIAGATVKTGLAVNGTANGVAELRVVESDKRIGALPRHRSMEFSDTHVLIAAIGRKNELRWWTLRGKTGWAGLKSHR